MSQSMNNLLIAPFKTGLETDLEPWIAPLDAFTKLDNIHIHHDYLQKREGYRIFGALIPMGASVNISTITQANPGAITTAAPHGYSTGDKVFITAVGGMTEVNDKIYTITVTGASTFTIGIDTSGFTAYAAGGTTTLTNTTTDRVMGITRYIDATNTKTTLAFNARRAYRFNTATNLFVQLDVANIFTSGEYDYVWSANWQSGGGTNRLYFTNGVSGTPAGAATSDGIRYFDGTTAPNVTTAFNPTLSPSAPAVQRVLDGAKLIFSLGQRLIVLHTYEYDAGTLTTTTYPQRARWCSKQNPANWDDVTAGGGGFTDAATGDQIISARILQNQIIVFFTNSVWTLIPTSDPNRAFRWQRINSFRACDGKMASIGYDRYVVALGVRGITATDGVETRRIDSRISEFSADDINVSEFNKVFCERSYNNLRWWTLYNDTETVDNENNSALIYDDNSHAFSTYEIDVNCLGYGNFARDFGLDDFVAANNLDLALVDFGDEDLFSYFWQDNQETLLGGDLNGNIYVMETDGDDNGKEIPAEFFTVAWNPYKEEGRECQLNYIDFYVDTNLSTKATIFFYKDTDISSYTSQQIDFLPNLNFIASINNISLTNPLSLNVPSHGLATGDVVYIYGVEGTIEANSGEGGDAYTITVVDANNLTLDGIDGTAYTEYTTGGALYLRPFYQTKTWKRVFGGGIGFQHRIKFFSTGIDKHFKIHGMAPSFKKRGKRSIN
jgi:hypothetical protein